MQSKSFSKKIWDYYEKGKRDLPWRVTQNPYHIFVSEVMLQQTQVARVLQKYPLFLQAFPTFKLLANASLSQVLSLWQGLGYNRRALFLQKSARIIMDTYQGTVPQEKELLQKLPGIGAYTAASIVVFSFNTPLVFIETNIRRVFLYTFFQGQKNVADKDIFPLIEKTLDRHNPREWYYALMDYGAFLGKTLENPNKRSKGYKVQSVFKGSLRQVRGAIIRVLLDEGLLHKDELYTRCTSDLVLFQNALLQLEQEQFITIHNQMVSIVHKHTPLT